MNFSPLTKKIFGILLITLSGFLFLMTLISLIEVFSPTSQDKIMSNILSSVLMGAITFIPYAYGMHLYQQAKSASLMVDRNLYAQKSLSFSTTIQEKEFLGLQLRLLSQKPWLFYIFVIGIIFLTAPLLHTVSSSQTTFYLLLGGGFSIFVPISMYLQIKQQYQKHSLFSQVTSYQVTIDAISINNQDLKSTVFLTSLTEIIEKKEWFILAEKNGLLMLIPKKALATKEDIDTFRGILLTAPNAIKKLLV